MLKGIEAVAIGLVVFILAQKLISTLVTGTDTGSVIKRIVTLGGNSHRITRQIRGKLTLATGKLITELNQRLNLGNCGETRRRASYKIGWWYSPILLERVGQRLNPDLGRSIGSIWCRILFNEETLESNLHSKQRKFGGTLNWMRIQQADAEPSRESSDFRACVETRNVRPTRSGWGRWHSPLSCESMS